MKVVMKPKEEVEILKTAKPGTKSEAILEETFEKAQCCVDHLCGCKS